MAHDREIEEAAKRALLYGQSFVQVKIVDPYKRPWWRGLWLWIRRWPFG